MKIHQVTPLWHVYVRDGIAFIRDVARTDAGYCLDVEPVRMAKVADPRIPGGGRRAHNRTWQSIRADSDAALVPEACDPKGRERERLVSIHADRGVLHHLS